MCQSRLWSGHKVIVSSGLGSHTPCFSLDSASVHSVDKATEQTVTPYRTRGPNWEGDNRAVLLKYLRRQICLSICLSSTPPLTSPPPFYFSLSSLGCQVDGWFSRWLSFHLFTPGRLEVVLRWYLHLFYVSLASEFRATPLHFSAGQKFVHYVWSPPPFYVY